MRSEPSKDWKHYEVWQEVKDALYALPAHFKSETIITGIHATDLQTLNSPVSTAIEDQVVGTLNAMRKVWDPQDQYSAYGFYRQSQTFPDVVLKRHAHAGPGEIILGIELKGWYLLAKEAVPSLRFVANRNACADADLICIVPWALSNTISGSPRAYAPWVESAKYAADFRTYYWQHTRQTTADRGISFANDAKPYPSKSSQIADVPAEDNGDNFGRIARTRMMDAFIEEALDQPLSGIPARYWLGFFKAFKDNATRTEIEDEIRRLQDRIAKET